MDHSAKDRRNLRSRDPFGYVYIPLSYAQKGCSYSQYHPFFNFYRIYRIILDYEKLWKQNQIP